MYGNVINVPTHFGGHFNLKSSLVHTLSCDRQFAQYVPCCRLVTTNNISYCKHLRHETGDFARLTLMPSGYVRFTTSRRKNHTSSVFNMRCRRRERFLVWTSEWRCCAGKTQIIALIYRIRQSCHRSRVEFGL